MNLLQIQADGQFMLTEHDVRKLPPYAILSHTWSLDSREEVTFKDIEERTGQHKPGYRKLTFCGRQAAIDRLEYFWVDSCCINRPDLAELSEAIVSMFRWYRKADKCYAYLSDVSTGATEPSQRTWERQFRNSKWFTRGWTLQELLAPRSVEFFTVEGVYFGSRDSLWQEIHDITGIPRSALQGTSLKRFGVERRFSWMRGRECKKVEDMAYSLLGIFDVSMPVIYGEGEDAAMRRLRQEIDGADQSQKNLPAPTAQVARKSKTGNKTEASWANYLESREKRGSCRNCGAKGHRERYCKGTCGRCERSLIGFSGIVKLTP
jgi:hypothetical protein